MTKRILFCATVDTHFEAFHLPYMKWFQERNWEVHAAANGNLKLPYVNEKFNLPIQRSPFDVKNIKAYADLKKIINDNNYKIIHSHTPMGGLITRLAAYEARKSDTKVIYTAHGFHFCTDSPLLNWIVYYPIERILAYITDCLITINQEDYLRAVNHRFKAGQIKHVHGVGVDVETYQPISHEEKKQKLRLLNGFKADDFLMIYVAEFTKNKNQQFLIRVLAKLKASVPNARLILAGDGPMLECCRALSKELKVTERVKFLGYNKQVHKILPMCDIAIASSYREGLPVNIMEAMACGLPVIATENRGHRELVRDGANGWLICGSDVDAMSEKIQMIAKNKILKNRFGCLGRKIVENKHSITRTLDEMSAIYSKFMG